ncbi:MAG: Spy/CpxP family protein refolding chaperone [Gammaproteobacteria bacterium]|nr:Spy/CpxP family protein refolding chaperone [Gammaproteobacteria bacterium]
MKKNIIGGLSAAVLSLALVQAAPVYAMHKSCPEEGQCMMKKIDEMKASLALTPEQEKQIKAIREKNRAFMEEKHKEKRMIHKAADMIAEARVVDKMKLDRLAERAGRLQSEILKNHVMTKHDIGQILNQQQKDKLKKDMQMMKKNMMQKRMSQ